MYGQGGYPQYGRGSQTPSPQFPQHPVAPSFPPFQQGSAASQRPVVQQGPPSILPHLGHSGPPLRQHAPSNPVQLGPPVQAPASGMTSMGQSYFPRPPVQQVRGSTSTDHSYPTVQQNTQWTHNLHHIPPPVPPPLGPPARGTSRPEMFGHPLPTGALPGVPAQGQTPYRGPINVPQLGGVQGTQQHPLPIPPPPPPPPPTSSLFTSAQFGSFVHTVNQDINVPAMAPMMPPPPPSSPPPPPPSPPPPSSPFSSIVTLSSTPLVTASVLSNACQSGPTFYGSGFEVTAPGSVDKVVASVHVRDGNDGVLICDQPKNDEGPSSVVGSPVKEDLLTMNNTKLDLPPPPPKPANEEVVRKIDVLCQFIAKNGPGFEDMAREKESGNLDFQFLFGGEPGSEASVAHKYFEWVKKKCILEFKLQHEHGNSVSRSSDIDKNVSCSPPDSDMDMEDDITQPDEGHLLSEGFNSGTVSIPKEVDSLDKSVTPKDDEYGLVKDLVSGSSLLAGGGGGGGGEPKLSAFHNDFTCGSLISKIDSSVTNSTGAAECPSKNTDKASIHSVEDLNQFSTSASVAGISSDELTDKTKIGSSPFRLLQDYASDDSSEEDDKRCLEDVSPVRDLPSTATGAPSLSRDVVSNLRAEPGCKPLSAAVAIRMSPESVVLHSHSTLVSASDFNVQSQESAQKANIISIETAKTKETVGNNDENQNSIDNANCPEVLQPKDVSDSFLDAAPNSCKQESQKDVKYVTHPKVDEFGRLVREGAGDSDSDESHYTGMRGKRGRSRSWSRSRSRSRSHSPYDRRRRRRSPWRRKEKRSRSRSWSPRRRKSRSRSPTYRHGSESGGDKMRRNKGQLRECFDFLRGRCHRGAFCRYMHHQSDKSDGARHYRSKRQQIEVLPASSTYVSPEEIKAPFEGSAQESDTLSNFAVSRAGNLDREKVLVSIQDAVQAISNQDDKYVVAEVTKSERPKEEIVIMRETQDIEEEILESTTTLPDNENGMKQGETVHQQQVDQISSSNTSLFQPSSTIQNQRPVGESRLMVSLSESNPGASSISQSFSYQSLPHKDLTPSLISSVELLDHHEPLPPPPPVPSRGSNTLGLQHGSKLSSLSPAVENCPPYQGPLQSQHSHFAASGSSSWSLPPPPSLPSQPPFVNYLTGNSATAVQGVPPLPYQQNQLPPRNEFTSEETFGRAYPPELPAHSQASNFWHNYPSMQEQEDAQPSLPMDDFRPKALPVSNTLSQPSGSTGLAEEHHWPRGQLQDLNRSKLFSQENILPQTLPSLRDSVARPMQSLPGDNLPPGGFFTSSSHNLPSLQQQWPPYDRQQPAADDLSINPSNYGNVNSSVLRYTSNLHDKNQPSYLSDFRGSRSHYNPYASTFDQPLSSKFSVNVFKQEDMPYSNLYDGSYSLSRNPVEDHGFGGLRSRHMTSPPKFDKAADLPRSGSDQYDPLFDSIEPSSNSFKKLDSVKRHELTNDPATLERSGSHKPFDLDENKQQANVGVVSETLSVKSENDEFGEMADAEVGDVENVSASNPIDAVNTASGEVEIDQVKTPGKSKKKKDSRQMKLFKVALADFVKEVLKPSWRQGNMSKEAFKTIVKKTVDKVSGAMKGHQIPKSQTKINQYIDSSQRKLTKLVMGYVQKYCKA